MRPAGGASILASIRAALVWSPRAETPEVGAVSVNDLGVLPAVEFVRAGSSVKPEALRARPSSPTLSAPYSARTPAIA